MTGGCSSFLSLLLLSEVLTLCTPQAVTETLKLGGEHFGDYFARSVSISDDYVAVGASYDDVNGVQDRGSVTVYKKNHATIAKQGTLFSFYKNNFIRTLRLKFGLKFFQKL